MANDSALKDVPEFFEGNLRESVEARDGALGTFRELGPPDLCRIVKSFHSGKPMREIGSYHYVSGVNASSAATLAAYFKSMMDSMSEQSSWLKSKNSWQIGSGTYCCYNAFSRIDVRVEFKFPGGIESYSLDAHGERKEVTDKIWEETYLSSLLRAILYSDDNYYRLAGYRKLDPITSPKDEAYFLKAVESLFWRGWQLGSRPEIQTPTLVHNHLTNAVMKYFGDSLRYGPAIELFEKLKEKEPQIGALLAEAYVGQNEEIKAFRTLYECLQLKPESYSLLYVQVDLLREKKEFEEALKLAKFAVKAAPSEFLTWSKLTEVYIDLKEYKNALLSLNSCPMFTYNERDMHRMPPPSGQHFPIKDEIKSSGIMEEDPVREAEVDPGLKRLSAPALHGTFAKAYSLLSQITLKIGWDDLLKYRSQVFVMEEEYRMQKAKEEERKSSFSRHSMSQRESTSQSQSPNQAKEAGETPKPEEKAQTEKKSQTDEEPQVEDEKVQTKDVSNDEQDETKTLNEDKQEEEALSENMENVDLNDEKETTDEKKESIDTQLPVVKPHSLERPRQAAEDKDKGQSSAANVTDDANLSFSNKRLCERWLDNLFMVLYDDLRMYTVWRTEEAHYETQKATYHKTGTERELLGDLSLRLWHEKEAKESYEKCLDEKFSAKAWMKLLEIYSKEGNTEKALLAAVKLTVYHQRWYHEIVYPTDIARNLNMLIRRDGLSKMRNVLTSMNLPTPVTRMMDKYFVYDEKFEVEGYDF